MNIIPTLTPFEADMQLKQKLVLQVAEATNHLASVLAATNETFWNLPTDRLLAILNADIAVTMATFGVNSSLGGPVNASLDLLGSPDFSHRAPMVAGRPDIVFDGTAFVYVPPVVVEPEITEPDA